MHPLVTRFARLFRCLPSEERERVAEQLEGFIGSYRAEMDRTWRGLLRGDGDGALSVTSAETLAELMTEAGIEPGTTRRSS